MSMVVPKKSMTVPAEIVLTGDLNEYGTPAIVFKGKLVGHWQVQNIEQLSGTERMLVQSGSYITDGKQIPENLNYTGGQLKLKNQIFEIFKVVPNYDIYGRLDYWRIITE